MPVSRTCAVSNMNGVLKQKKLKATWESGDYGHFAKFMEPGALDFLSRIEQHLPKGGKVLDVACGAGQIAVPLSLHGFDVLGVDLADNLVAQARAKAEKAGCPATFVQGDAESLPVPDAAFDAVISLIGAMFAPRSTQVAHELLRACKSGGTIAMGNWTPEGFIGQMFKIVSKHVPPSPLMDPPVKWGDETTIRGRLGPGCSAIECTKRMYPFKYPFSPEEVVDFFAKYYGPTVKAFGALQGEKAAALRAELVEHWSSHNVAKDGSTEVQAEYLEVVGIRA